MALKSSLSDPLLANLDGLLPELETIYKDIHSHPELSMQEERTAGIAADHLRAAGYEVTTGVGKTGLVGLLRNGEGPTVMLRAGLSNRSRQPQGRKSHHTKPLDSLLPFHGSGIRPCGAE